MLVLQGVPVSLDAFFLILKMKDISYKNRKPLVFLTGFMGSGKSTIGPILANTLGFKYIDMDTLIEERTNKRIADIFSTEGEQVFRALERKTLCELVGLDHHVISLGGGTIANDENCQLVKQNGILIYLKLSPDEIIQRVHHRNDRPMLKDEEGNQLPLPELKERIIQLLSKRRQFYSCADIIIDGDNMRIGATVDEIVKQLRGMIGKE
jgi:shikimate kinase